MGKLAYSWPGLLFISAHAFMAVDASHADPSIQILNVPAYGSGGDLQGVATGVNAPEYQVATYFHVEGFGWSSEPMLTVPLHADGTFSVPIVSGALDNRATIFA